MSGNDELSNLFKILSDEHRRRVLIALARANPREDEIISLEEVADHQGDGSIAVLQQELYHCHLPKLNDARLIDWNRDNGNITRGPQFDEIEPFLTLMDEHQDELPADWA
jgi:DNA-binding transcriptional ArsR family regulator